MRTEDNGIVGFSLCAVAVAVDARRRRAFCIVGHGGRGRGRESRDCLPFVVENENWNQVTDVSLGLIGSRLIKLSPSVAVNAHHKYNPRFLRTPFCLRPPLSRVS